MINTSISLPKHSLTVKENQTTGQKRENFGLIIVNSTHRSSDHFLIFIENH